MARRPFIRTVRTLAGLTQIALIAVACKSGPLESVGICDDSPTLPSRVSIRLTDPVLRVGLTTQLSATALDARGIWELCAPALQFASRDPSIASVSTTGLVTAYGAGTTYIRVSSGRVSDSVAIKVVATTLSTIAIKFAPSSLLLGQTVTLGVEARDTDGNVVTPISLTWRTDDAAIATITNTGLLVTVAEGTASVTLAGEGLTAVVQIPVRDEAPSRRFSQIAAGFQHSCAIVGGGGVPEGTAYCWGDGNSGQLGVGQTGIAVLPVRVGGEHSFVFIAAGDNSSCGIAASGETYCWGGNESGQLGDGTRGNRTTPTRVLTSQVFRSIALGSGITCGLVAAGSAYCWGRIGNATAVPPTLVPGGIQFVDLTGGGGFVCGRTGTGRAYCWGSTLSFAGPTPTPPLGDLTFSQVSAGTYHVCGVAVVDGLGYCWGRLDSQPLGSTVSVGTRTTPVAIPGGLRYTSVSAGGSSTCGVTENGTFCLGNTLFGGASITSAPTAVPREPRVRFATIASGTFHSCAIDQRGGGWCWGFNGQQQVGAGEDIGSANQAYQLLIR